MRRKTKTSSNIILIEEYSVEREIAENQLKILQEASRNRLLSYEETKIFDLLVKNLYLSKGEATTITAPETSIESPQEQAELLSLAQFVGEQKISDLINIIEEPAKDGSSQDPT